MMETATAIQFKNKFIQTKEDHGKCLLFCYANMLNDETILLHEPVCGKPIKEAGCGPMDGRKIIETWSKGELTVLHIAKRPVDSGRFTEVELFNAQTTDPLFVPMIAVVESPTFGKGILHAILVIHDIAAKSLIVLDPKRTNAAQMSYNDFVAIYQLYELEAIHDLKDGGGQGWTIDFFKHLIEQQ